MEVQVARVFVYGTLKVGQIRESTWPCRPIDISPAKSRGELYDLGEYPAMTPGDDWIAGDVWRFNIKQIPETLRVLDEIEDHRDEPDDLYIRVVINCELENGTVVLAYCYHYVQDLSEHPRVHPDEQGLCYWPQKQR